MIKAVIYGREVKLQGSPYTLLAYRSEFDGDLFKAILSAYEAQPPDMSLLLQVAWAMARTCDDEVPAYAEWLRGFDPDSFALGDAGALGVIDSAISAELFRRTKAGRARRWLGRRVDALAKRAGALADRLLARRGARHDHA